MSKLGTLVRTCPSCGHRFHVKLVDEKLLSDRATAEPVQKDGMMMNTGASAGVWGYPKGKVWSLFPGGEQEEGTFATRRKEFEDSFKCVHCGHQWSERREVETERVHR
jgi:hypothetical protein